MPLLCIPITTDNTITSIIYAKIRGVPSRCINSGAWNCYPWPLVICGINDTNWETHVYVWPVQVPKRNKEVYKSAVSPSVGCRNYALWYLKNNGNQARTILWRFLTASVVSILATGTRVRGFKPGRSRWIFRASKKSSVCLPSEGK
jgi:hypothetical protein